MIEAKRLSSPLLVLSIITRAHCRVVQDFFAPIPVEVYELELVDMALLEELETRGMVQIVITP
jgi:hypothetical protein